MNRVLTGLALVPVSGYVILWAPDWLFTGALLAIAALCFHEYVGLAAGYKLQINRLAGYATGFLLMLWDGNSGRVYLLTMMVALVLALYVSNLALSLPSAAGLLLGVAYVFGGWRAAIDLHRASPYWLLFAVTINWAGDTAAFYVGRRFGKRKLMMRVSPGKSWEGAYASLAASAVYGALLLHYFMPAVSVYEAVTISICANIAGQVGDLAESAMKRGAGVKDSGTLLPGHGGWLDRLDSSLFSMPMVYLWLSRG